VPDDLPGGEGFGSVDLDQFVSEGLFQQQDQLLALLLAQGQGPLR